MGAKLEDLKPSIEAAWLSLRQKILSDPHELQKRLARRRLASLTRPAPPWCIALRASDTRINHNNAIITPKHALDPTSLEHPYELIEHEIFLVKRTLQRLCRPYYIAFPGLTLPQ